jgi:hypothetical protein
MIRHVRRRWADRRTRVEVQRLPAVGRFASSVGKWANTAGIPGEKPREASGKNAAGALDRMFRRLVRGV